MMSVGWALGESSLFCFVKHQKLPQPPECIILVVVKGIYIRSRAEALDRIADYLNHGVQMVWHLIPRRREVRVFTPENREGVTLNDQGVLVGGDMLPGFAVPVRAILSAALRSTDNRIIYVRVVDRK